MSRSLSARSSLTCANGAVTFNDVDTLDTHTASFAPQGGGAGYRGTFALNPLNQAGDSFGWSFSVADSALDDLQAGQVLTQFYDVTVDGKPSGHSKITVTRYQDGTEVAATEAKIKVVWTVFSYVYEFQGQEQWRENKRQARPSRRGALYLLQGLRPCQHCG